jgi:hypothetical protein
MTTLSPALRGRLRCCGSLIRSLWRVCPALAGVFYRCPELRVAVFLDESRDQPGRRIEVTVSLTSAALNRTRLPGLVEAARFAPAHHVGWNPHTVAAMQQTLDDNANWLSRLMPVLLGPEALELARNLTRRPRRRPPGLKWKYA